MNKNRIKRIYRYKKALAEFQADGVQCVMSKTIADAVGEKDTQVRKDFSHFGITGVKKLGYQVDDLLNAIQALVRKEEIINVIIVGSGRLGSALMNYNGFNKEKINIVAAFDKDDNKQNQDSTVPVYSLSKLEEIVKRYSIRYGVIVVPEDAAQEVLDLMVSAGIKGFLNFSPVQLKFPDGIFVQTMNIAMEIENLSYYVNMQQEGA